MKATDFRIAPSQIVNREAGLFTTVPISKGQLVIWSWAPNGKKSEIFENAYIQSPFNSLVNHSYTPNLESFWAKDGKMYKRALRNIASGEELTSNYRDTMELIAPLGYTLRMDFLWFEK